MGGVSNGAQPWAGRAETGGAAAGLLKKSAALRPGETILVVSEQQMLAEALTTALGIHGHDVVGPFRSMRDALAAARARQTVLGEYGSSKIDVEHPDDPVASAWPGAIIVAVTAGATPATGSTKAVVLSPDVALDGLLFAIHNGLEGGEPLRRRSPTRTLRAADPEQRDADLLARQLTAREREVLGFLTHTAVGGEVARRLGISRNTVRTHVQNILTKLQVHSRLEAVAFAVRYGIITPEVTDAPWASSAGGSVIDGAPVDGVA